MSENIFFVDFGSFSIYWYGVFIGCAVFVAALVFCILRRLQGESFTSALRISLISMPTALITARIFYCWFGKASFTNGIMECANLMTGGYALYGALLGILAVLIVYSCVCGKSTLQMIDAAIPAVSLTICIGRFASITSGGDMGFNISSESIQKFPFAIWSESEQSWILWVGFFEGLAALLIFIFTLVIFILKYKLNSTSLQYGSVTLMFMLTYGLSQTILESMRSDSLFMVSLGFVRISQIISFIIAVTAIVIIIVNRCIISTPDIPNIALWAICAAAIGAAMYCEFKMNASVMVKNYIIMGVALVVMMSIALFMFFQNAKLRKQKSNS